MLIVEQLVEGSLLDLWRFIALIIKGELRTVASWDVDGMIDVEMVLIFIIFFPQHCYNQNNKLFINFKCLKSHLFHDCPSAVHNIPKI